MTHRVRSWKHLRALIESGTFGPEHLFYLARRRTPESVALLVRLRQEATLAGADALWLNVVLDLVDGGYEKLWQWTNTKKRLKFALGVVSEVRGEGSVDFLVELLRSRPTLQVDSTYVGAVNLVLSFKGAPIVTESQRAFLEEKLLEGLRRAKGDTALGGYHCALRGVGGGPALSVLGAARDLGRPYDGVRQLALRAIKQRMSRGQTGDG